MNTLPKEFFLLFVLKDHGGWDVANNQFASFDSALAVCKQRYPQQFAARQDKIYLCSEA
jgi:hypothetical protein